MNLLGWDLVSVCSFERLNRALAAGAGRLLTTFSFAHGRVHASGRFGAWRVVPGGSGAFLDVELPIAQAIVTGLSGSSEPRAITGVAVVVQIALKLLPAADGKGRELRFDVGETALNGKGISVHTVADPAGRLSEMDRALVGDLVAACLAANAERVAFVFARVGGLASSAPWVAAESTDWCHFEPVGGEPVLALLGCTEGRDAARLERAIDPAALAGSPAGMLALSQPLLVERAILPHLAGSWFSDMKLVRNAAGEIVSTRAKRLPEQRSGPFVASPVIDRVQFRLAGDALDSVCQGHADLPLGARFDFRVATHNPFAFDPARRAAQFKADPSPRVEHTTRLPGILDPLVGWLVRLILSLFTQQIGSSLASVASSVQSLVSPPVEMVGWVGVDFAVTEASLHGDLVLIDRRPA
ncbi:MAG TPA: TULIP family P47-like protein [Myxococcota bacterium]|nr:TULIP family P47-like protein [Myxococcota bacterium]